MRIIAFPPVGYVASRWEEIGDIQTGVSFFDGKHIDSALGPVRVSATLRVSASSSGRSGSGYMEILKRQMRHGIDRVRVKSPPVNRYFRAGNADLRTAPVAWTDGGAAVDWTDGGTALRWFSGAAAQGTPSTDAKGFDQITVTGLPPGVRVVRPADVLRAFAADGTSATARAMTEAMSDASGVAVIRLDGPLPAGVISIGDFEERVFKLDGPFPSAEQTVRGDWFYPINLIEVLPTEYAGATEVDPWT